MTAAAERALPESDRSSLLARWLPWLVGLAAALIVVPIGYLDGSAPRLLEPDGDLRQHLVGWKAFLAEGWNWPPLTVQNLRWPEGANLLYADVIPGLALLAKAWHGLTGASVNYFGPWIFATFLLQPVAGAFLLRSFGVRHPVAILAGALLALALPIFFHRAGHPVLQAHWLLLFALGLALRTARDANPRRPLAWLALLATSLLLVNAYLFAMAATLLLAAIAEAARRRALSWLAALLLAAAWLGLSLGLLWLLGYVDGAAPAWGFGYYSMNLLSPVMPQLSGLLPGYTDWLLADVPGHPQGRDVLDATRYQAYEGYNFLGVGTLLLLLLAAGLGWRRLWPALRRQPFVIAACLALAVFALSHVVWLGYGRLVTLPEPPEFVQQFRSSGRFFWPLAYLLMAGAAALLWTSRPRFALYALPVLALLQLADVRVIAERAWERMRTPEPIALAPAAWRPLIAAHDLVRIYPSYECRGWKQRYLMDVVFLAVDLGRRVTTMYLSRLPDKDCTAEDAERSALRPIDGELVVLFDSADDRPTPPLSPALAPDCRRFDGGLVCTPRWKSLPPEVSGAFP